MRLQGLDASVFVLCAVDLHNREVFADCCGLLTHDLGEVVLKLNRLDAELVVGPLVLSLEAAACLQGVLDDLVGLSLRDVRDDDVDVAGGRILRQSEDGAGVRLLVLAQ